MENLLQNDYITALIVLVVQFLFLWLRTLNIMYTSEKKLIPTLITGNLVAICMLVGASIGFKTIMEFRIIPLIGHLIGGSLGVIYSFKFKGEK